MISALPMSSNRDAGNDGHDDGAPSSPATKRLRVSPAPEPTSVLYNRSPSPPTSSSAPLELPPPISADDFWEAVVSGDMAAARSQPTQDSSFLHWIMDADAQVDDAFDPFFLAPPPLEPFFLQPNKEDVEEPRAVVDEVLEAAHRADAGDTTGAHEILTRLNHRLPSPPPPPGHVQRPPLLRAAAHLRDALLRRLVGALPPAVPSSSPLDVALKLAAHKALADASPTVQFDSFTSTQAVLDALAGARRVHVVDLDVGFGARWPPLMQELALQWRRRDSNPNSLEPPPGMKLTALVSPGSAAAHPLELRLARDSLTRFAADLGIRFEFTAVVFDPSDNKDSPSPPVAAAPGEAVAVHLPLGLGSPPAPATLRVVRQLRPAVVVCVDDLGGCHRGGDLNSLLNAVAAFLESLDAGGAQADAVAKVEHYILRPRLERMLLAGGDRRMPPPWQAMLASAGFAPVQLSTAAEAQAECLARRAPTSGFNVERRQAALALRWKQSELVTVSAWCSAQGAQIQARRLWEG